ncbi:probable serine/threonine-protein kinase PBL21 [Magnolia sinica]|uniref:probable serine/threonine-protein kinase PBL21 n=1 Tax=Magnolia sinica TaxID=86752 RepID=UPI002657E0DE|nr:probable serine/threonine-protein kinase PBL21 [Magnolia sinica]
MAIGAPDDACLLNYTKYPYEPPGECISRKVVVREWDSITTNSCCRNALNAFSQALALQALQNDYIFLHEKQWLHCQFPVPPQDSIDINACGFHHLNRDSSVCSSLSLSSFRTTYVGEYSSVLEKCSNFDSLTFNDSCLSCTYHIEEMREYLMGQLHLKDNATERDICGVAVVIAVSANKIENETWVDNYYRCLPALDKGDPFYFKIKYSTLKIIIWIIIPTFVLILTLVVGKHVVKEHMKKKKKKNAKFLEGKRSRTWSGLYRFSKAEIESAINFNTRKVCLGSGSAGRVFKGILPSGQIVAIKHIFKDNTSDRFTREVEGWSRIRHPNLVCLFGCCEEDGDQYLVYEYCSYGNLAQHLQRSDSFLSWDIRVKIMRDCALALRFLHSYPDGCIVHRDIKLTNILLTEDMDPKLSDFGLAKMLGMDETRVFTDAKGSIGYMDPEYMTNGKLTSASDVYGFGIITLQILSGKQVFELDRDARDNLTRTAKEVQMQKRPLSDFEDPRMEGNYNAADFESILYIAVLCVANSSKGRPTINVVFEEMDKVWRNTEANMVGT